MKRNILSALVLMVLPLLPIHAQKVDDYGVFNHLGVGLSAGSQGISIDAAAPLTKYLELNFGVNFMPGFTLGGDAKLNINTSGIPAYIPIPDNLNEVRIDGDLARTTLDFRANVYPFGGNTSFFLSAGFSFGGKKLAKLTGSNEAIAQQPILREFVSANIDKYNLQFDEDGNVNGDIRVKAFRPYLGLGFGRMTPGRRLGFRLEAGCQFMGKMKIYQNGEEFDTNDFGEKGDDKISDIIDAFQVYPVIKLTLTGRIL